MNGCGMRIKPNERANASDKHYLYLPVFEEGWKTKLAWVSFDVTCNGMEGKGVFGFTADATKRKRLTY